MAYSLQARVVYPVDRPPIENGVVTIEGERIVAVGKQTEAGEVIDLGDVALLPGLVNAHTHLEFSYLQQPLGRPGMPLVEWVQLVIAERSRRQPTAGMQLLLGIEESHRGGVTTIGDISTSGQTIDADVRHFHEVIGFSRARAESALLSVVQRIVDQEQRSPHVCQGISPHAPYTVSPELYKDLVFLTQGCYRIGQKLVTTTKRYLPVATHLAESLDELQLLRDGSGPFQALLEERSMWDRKAIPNGSRPLDYLKMLSEAALSLVIHGNYLDEEELVFLGEQRSRMSLVYCPRTHTYFFHRAYPLGRALALGVRVALGTDSRASNPDLSLLDEIRCAAREHPAIPAHTFLHMGTLAGAEALGRDRDVGSITLGKTANLVAVPLPAEASGTPDDLLAAIFADDAAPSAVYLAGRRL